jgi:hypothetical protein
MASLRSHFRRVPDLHPVQQPVSVAGCAGDTTPSGVRCGPRCRHLFRSGMFLCAFTAGAGVALLIEQTWFACGAPMCGVKSTCVTSSATAQHRNGLSPHNWFSVCLQLHRDILKVAGCLIPVIESEHWAVPARSSPMHTHNVCFESGRGVALLYRYATGGMHKFSRFPLPVISDLQAHATAERSGGNTRASLVQ